MKSLFAVAMGGALGAVARYVLSNWVYQWLGRSFPWGTLVVNVVGSFLMGFLFFLFSERVILHPDVRIALLVGGLGALTTFSTFSIETFHLIEDGLYLLAVANILASVVLCVGAVWLGILSAKIV